MDTSKPHQNATAPALAEHDANAQAYAEDAPNSAIDDALARILGNPPAAECPIMVLLVDDQAIIAEAIRQALAGEGSVDFHYCASPEEAVRSCVNTGKIRRRATFRSSCCRPKKSRW
jgi:two-component system chemotaxis family response regulator WspR